MLYGAVIPERFRNPKFRGRIEAPDAAYEDVNPLCGDRIAIEGRVAGGQLVDARHHGDSCAICAASADLLLEMTVGRPVREALGVGVEAVLERLEAPIRPTRMKCVALPVTVLREALAGRGARP